MSNVPTYKFQNILLVLLSAPPFLWVIEWVSYYSFPIPMGVSSVVTIEGTIAFIAAGTILSLTCARKIKHMAVSGQGEEGLRFAKRVHRYFLGVLIMTWILGLLISVYMPVSYHAAQRSHTCNITAKSNLKNFYTAAEKYFQENPEGTIDMELAEQYGFKPTPGVKLEVRSGQRFNFTATASFQPPSEPYDPSGTKMYTINNHGEIVEQKMSDR